MFVLINNRVDRRRTLRVAVLLGGVALGLGWTATAQAATNLFLTWPGIIGTSTVQGHVGDIELLAYSQNASNTPPRNLGGGPGGGGGRGGANAICGQINILKRVDSTSPVFLGMVLSGSVTPGPVTVTFANSASTTVNNFYTVSLRNVVPTSITQSDSQGADAITESIVLTASQFVFTFTPQLPNGSFGTPVTFGWDCANNRQI
jgi:type VI secretion system secreted protein Hcp